MLHLKFDAIISMLKWQHFSLTLALCLKWQHPSLVVVSLGLKPKFIAVAVNAYIANNTCLASILCLKVATLLSPLTLKILCRYLNYLILKMATLHPCLGLVPVSLGLN